MKRKAWLPAVCCAALLIQGCAWFAPTPPTAERTPAEQAPTEQRAIADPPRNNPDQTQGDFSDTGYAPTPENAPPSSSKSPGESPAGVAESSLSVPPGLSSENLSGTASSAPSADAAAAPLPPVSEESARRAADLVRDAKALWTGENCADLDRAVAMLDAALVLAPDSPETLLWRGRALADQGYLADAFDDLTLSIRLRPTALAYAARGLTGMRLGNMAGARQDLDRALTLDKAELHALLYRSAWFFLHDESRRGCADLQQACRNGLCRPLEDAKADGLCHPSSSF